MPDPIIHQFDPDMLPDSRFAPGELRHLVPGNQGRMLDRRRTPIQIYALRPETGSWTCEVLAFEDRGARWEPPFEKVSSFQFALDSDLAGRGEVEAFAAAVARFDRPLEIPCDPAARERSLQRLAVSRREAADWLNAESLFFSSGGRLDPHALEGDARLWRDLRGYLEQHGLWPMELEFSSRYVSNPHSGELVKGHLIVLAELGLTPYRGTIVRDPAVFVAPWERERRARHLLVRMAFVQAALAAAGLESPVLYRAISDESALEARPAAGLVSTTFSREVANSFFGPPGETRNAVLCRQVVPLRRLFMTYFETEAMNRVFREAEAVLLADPGNPMF